MLEVKRLKELFDAKGGIHTYIKIGIVAVFVMLVAVQAEKSFVLDEIDFPIVSHATSQSGKPIYYRGEVSPLHVGTYHPTLYINSLASFIRVFGFSETTVRFFGIMCTLLSAFLLVMILRRLIGKNQTAENLLLALFLFNPYTIASTTLPDIDSTILPVVVLLFIHASLRLINSKKDLNNRAVVLLGILFGVALWTKLTTPLVLPPILASLSFIASKDYKRSALFTIKVTVLGGVAFLTSYFLYTQLLSLSSTYTYTFLWDSFTKGTSGDSTIEGIAKNLKFAGYYVYWLTIPLVGLLSVSLIGLLSERSKEKSEKIIRVLALTGLLTTVFYIALIAPFGGFFKYPFPVHGLLMLTIVFYYHRYLSKISKIDWLYAFLALCAGFVIQHAFWQDSMFLDNEPFEHAFLLALAVAVVSALLKFKRTIVTTQFFILLIFFSIGFQLSISRIQAISAYPTKYHYGQTGLDKTTAYLRSNTEPNEIIWSMKDVGYYTNNRYYESYAYYFNPSLEQDLIDKLTSGEVRYYVVTNGIGQDNIDAFPNIKQILTTHADIDKRFGDFIIYKAKYSEGAE